MQKGSFKCRSFHFTGDGRNKLNDGTAAGGNGITVNNMAISILCNAAACFIESGEWVEDSSMLSGASTMTVRDNTISFLDYTYTADYSQPTTPHVYYTYLKRAGVSDYASAAKIMLMYQATRGMRGINEVTGGVSGQSSSGNNRYYQIVDRGGLNFESSPSAACDLSLIYLPGNGGTWNQVLTNGGTEAKNFRVMALEQQNYWSVSYPISSHNTNLDLCSYHILTSESTIGVFFTHSAQPTIIKGFVIGDLLEPSSLGPRDNFMFNTLAAFSTQLKADSSSGDGLYMGADYFLSGNYNKLRDTDFTGGSSVPITQFFVPDGKLCSASLISNYATTNGQCIVWTTDDWYCFLVNKLKTASNQLVVAPIGIGIKPSAYYTYYCHTVDPITGSCYKGQFDLNVLFSSGRQLNSSGDSPMFAPGDLFDNGNFIHLGDGIWMGWHPDNGSIFTNTGEEMVVYNPAA